MADNTQTRQLSQALMNCADILRSKMDANEYRSYLLGIIFYKYLSDKMLYDAAGLLEQKVESLKEAQALYEESYADADTRDGLLQLIKEKVDYTIEPHLTFTSLVNEIDARAFQLDNLKQAFNNIENASPTFYDLFEDIDLYAKKLGTTPQKQNETIASIMKELDALDLAGHNGDVLGDAYEYLIGMFAGDSGKKAGEFYTPQPVAKLMTQIVMSGREDKKGFTVYDATMGSGSLLLNARKYSNVPETIKYFGQELNTSTYNLARMNMLLHDVPVAEQTLHNGDTLDGDWPTQEPTNFDGVLMNPPYSANWSAESGFLQDQRFNEYGVLAPKSKADFAFLLHGFYHLKQNGGVMSIVLPHGVLFRGNAEGTIRKKLLENGSIDAVIGLPANIFYNTSIPTTVIILRKDRAARDVLFIDASKEFDKGKNQNIMTDEHIAHILEAYEARGELDKFSHLASFEEIAENDFNLNIPRYVDTYEEEEVRPLAEIMDDLLANDAAIKKTQAELLNMMLQLKATDTENQVDLDSYVKRFETLLGKV